MSVGMPPVVSTGGQPCHWHTKQPLLEKLLPGWAEDFIRPCFKTLHLRIFKDAKLDYIEYTKVLRPVAEVIDTRPVIMLLCRTDYPPFCSSGKT